MKRACFTNTTHIKATSLILLISILTITKCNSQQINGSLSENDIIVLDGVSIIDGTGAPIKSSMSITIKNGKITAIHKQGEVDYPKSAIIDKFRTV